MIDPDLLAILVCPVTKAPLVVDEDGGELLCAASGLAYPVRDGIPVMLQEQARDLTQAELEWARGKRRGDAARPAEP